ncbi:MAG: hypothetical protein R2695_15805 [Acidimicrobiales bacterium]
MHDRPRRIPGGRLIEASWLGTAAFTVTAAIATIDPDRLGAPAVVVDAVLFVGGLLAMIWAFLVAVQRSRVDAIGMGGLYFGAGPPGTVRRHLLGSLAVEVVVALVTASIRIFTSLAFGILVPVWALGMAGAWCAVHGQFAPREGPAR